MCQLLLAAASSNEAAACGIEVVCNNQMLWLSYAGWAAALLMCIYYLILVRVQRMRQSKPKHHAARAHGSRCGRRRGHIDVDVMVKCRPFVDVQLPQLMIKAGGAEARRFAVGPRVASPAFPTGSTQEPAHSLEEGRYPGLGL